MNHNCIVLALASVSYRRRATVAIVFLSIAFPFTKMNQENRPRDSP